MASSRILPNPRLGCLLTFHTLRRLALGLHLEETAGLFFPPPVPILGDSTDQTDLAVAQSHPPCLWRPGQPQTPRHPPLRARQGRRRVPLGGGPDEGCDQGADIGLEIPLRVVMR